MTRRLIHHVQPMLSDATNGAIDAQPEGAEGLLEVLETLTAREVEVLKLMADGRSNQEIASDLVISEPTVKTHVAHILQKTASRDRVQAVVFAYESGLIAR